MWFFNKQKNIVGIALSANSIKLSVITAERPDIYQLTSYHDYTFEKHEICDSLIFNATQLEAIITQFLRDNKLKNIRAVLSLADSLITEIITPEIDQAMQERLAFRAHQAYPILVGGQKGIYSAAMSHELFFQLQLLVHATVLKVSTLTTENMVLYNLFHRFTNPVSTQEPMTLDITRDITGEILHNYMLAQVAANPLLDTYVHRTIKNFPTLTYRDSTQTLGLYLIGMHEAV